ncbi:MAG: TonB-dependent receptor [bacterium]|nr:TonB-dependent receptor [bacterium]
MALGQADSGRIEGKVVTSDGIGVGGVSVVLEGTSVSQTTDATGQYAFTGVPAGSLSITFSLGDSSAVESGVEVTAGATTAHDVTVDWQLGFAETITVHSASRRTERIVEAPAAVTIVTAEEIERHASTGQLPKLLEFTPGVEVTQNGVYYYNFNTRGFNSSLNRRVLVLIDGRDPSTPSLGTQEWSAIPFPLDELETVELVRGPGSALYGADAFNGVLNMTTKSPRTSQGGQLRFTGGELATMKLDLRHAAELGGGWYYKILGGYAEHHDFTRARTTSVEYSVPCTAAGEVDCLPPEVVSPIFDRNKILFGTVRFDKALGNGNVLTLEGGTARIEGMTPLTPVGRMHLVDGDRPWLRINLNSLHWNVLANHTLRDIDHVALATDVPNSLDASRTGLEAQGNTDFADGRGFLVGGMSLMEKRVDSADRQGIQTLLFESKDDPFYGVFGQVEYGFTDRLRGVLAARWDDSPLYDAQFSPRASVVYALSSRQSLRLSYSEAFQVPNHLELFVAIDVAEPVPLQFLEPICTAGGSACGFDRGVRVMAVGNEDLDPERITSVELGYSGLLGKNFYLTLDLYDHEIVDFITDLIGFVNPTIGGPIQDNFPPYMPPDDLADAQAGALLALLETILPPPLFAILSNAPNGDPIFTAFSAANFGEVRTEGLEIGLSGRLGERWTVDFNYSYSDFDVRQQLNEDPVLPNTSANKFGIGLSYVGARLDTALKYRYTEGFDWNSGLFTGPVPSYDIVDLTANYRITPRVRVGLDVSNLLNNRHYELFGGDLLDRRALAHVSFSW